MRFDEAPIVVRYAERVRWDGRSRLKRNVGGEAAGDGSPAASLITRAYGQVAPPLESAAVLSPLPQIM